MEVITDQGECPAFPAGSVVSIGAYDGVHLGHRALIAEVNERAAQLGCASVVATFDRHPAMVVRPDSAPKLLTDLEQKLELLASTGIAYTLVVRFDEERANETAEDFVREVLVGCLKAQAVVVGHDFHFGHGRKGNVALLQELGGELGFDVLGLRLIEDDGHTPYSSTRIRQLLSEGAVEEAATMLGRHHEVRGVVKRGDGRGGPELGYPTANVAVPPEILLPADGIYAGWYERPSGDVHSAAISIGRRPTFYDDADSSLLEAYLLDFDADLYGEHAKVRFVTRLRDELKFDSVEALIAQMGKDVEAARRSLSHS